MANLSTFEALGLKINQFIKTNFQQLITGEIMNGILHDVKDTTKGFIDTLSTSKLDKSAIGYDATGINLPAGNTYKVNGVDILSLFVAGGGGFVGSFDATGALPTTGTGTAGAIRKGDYWRVTVAGTVANLSPNDDLVPGDVLLAVVDNPSNVNGFVSIAGNQDIAQILTRLAAAETKLNTIEVNATADQTPAEIKAALEGLTEDNRLDFSAVKNIMNAPYYHQAFPDLQTIKQALDYILGNVNTLYGPLTADNTYITADRM